MKNNRHLYWLFPLAFIQLAVLTACGSGGESQPELASVANEPLLSREQAIQIALDQHIYPSDDHQMVALLWPEPITPSDEIRGAYDDVGFQPTNESWFVWIDDDPFAYFSHPVRYLFIDRTNAETEILERDELPLLNDEAMWGDADEYLNEENRIFSNFEDFRLLSVQVTDYSNILFRQEKYSSKALIESLESLSLQSGDEKWCDGKGHKVAILLSGADFGNLFGDIVDNITLMRSALEAKGYTAYGVFLGRSGKDGYARLGEIIKEHQGPEHCCDQIIVYYTGHGKVEEVFGEEQFFFGLRPKSKGEKKLSGEVFAAVVAGMGSCHIQVIVDACYSGALLDDFKDYENIETITTSAARDERAYSGVLDGAETSSKINVRDPWIPSEGRWDGDTRGGRPREPGSEFSSGFIKGITEFPGNADVASALIDAALLEALENDVTALAGRTHPVHWHRIRGCNCRNIQEGEESSSSADFDGSYAAAIDLSSDPGGHEEFVGMPSTTQLEISDSSIQGSHPFVDVEGSFSEDGRFNTSGRGTVAGFANIAIEFNGTIIGNILQGQYAMGTHGGLPGGQKITFSITATRAESLQSIESSDPGLGHLEASDLARYFFEAGLELYEQGNLDDALDLLEQSIATDSENPAAYYYRALVYLDLGNSEDAIADFNRSIEIAPARAAPYYNLALYYDDNQEFELALDYYRLFVERYSNDDDFLTYALFRIESLE